MAMNFPDARNLPRNKDGDRGTSLRKEGLPYMDLGWRGTSLRKGGTRYISKVATDLPCWSFYLRKYIFKLHNLFLIA